MPPVRLDTSLETLLERHRVLAAPGALATIVATAGSTYRKAGARMLIEADGRMTGLLSGGCLEGDLRERALDVLGRGVAGIVEYDMRSDDDLIFGIGAGCEGAMRILVEPAPAGGSVARALATASAITKAGRGAALLVGIEGAAGTLGTRAWPTPDGDALEAPLQAACVAVLAAGASRSARFSGAGVPNEAWIQYLAPIPQVLVCGAGPDAVPLAELFGVLGMAVTVVDHRPAHALAARFPRARVVLATPGEIGAQLDLGGCLAAVVMSHHLVSDAGYLRALAASEVPYVGLLGPRARRERLLDELGELAPRLVPRLRGPIGLDIGAVTPESIALSIAAEIHAFAAGRAGGAFTRPAPAP